MMQHILTVRHQRELAFIVSAAFVKVMRIKDLEQVIALAPALTKVISTLGLVRFPRRDQGN